MIKFIIITLLILISGSTLVYAYRIPKPQRITDFDQNGLVIINESLEQLWDITNGRYVPDVKNSVPTNSPPEGSMVVYSSGGVYRIYIYLNSGWRVWTSD